MGQKTPNVKPEGLIKPPSPSNPPVKYNIINGEIAKLELKKDDKLVLTLEPGTRLTQLQIEEIKKILRKFIDADNEILVIHSMDLKIVRKNDTYKENDFCKVDREVVRW